ncbi:MAG: hypothetical protein NTY45_09640 [Elusimicrobia bacterium]|nr:hypothetical protein [Elusimicrobiota bacterium]
MTVQKAFWSTTAGVLVGERTGEAPPKVHSIGIQDFSDQEAGYYLSSITDWEEVEFNDITSLLGTLTTRYWVDRAHALAVALLSGLSEVLEKEVLEELEQLIQTRIKAKSLLSLLLVAPLASPAKSKSLAVTSLKTNLPAIAAVWDKLSELQPLINRFSSLWLTIPEESFLQYARHDLWVRVATEEVLPDLLESPNSNSFRSQWNTLLFKSKQSPDQIKSLNTVGITLTGKLFPHGASVTPMSIADELPEEHIHKKKFTHYIAAEEKDSALKQVAAIAKTLAEGKDDIAHKYLRELVKHQVAGGDTEFVLKSLCNIAKKCADTFRIDFEHDCLLKALSLSPSDSWTLIQWGDHLKRTGDYDLALEAMEKAWQMSGNIIAQTIIADIWAMQGKREKALSIYKKIENCENNETVRTAIGDILRRDGHLENAEKEYDYVISKWESHRAYAGKAEIAKNKLLFQKSLSIYEKLLENPDTDEHSRAIYRSAQCRLFKLMGRFTEAYKGCELLLLKLQRYDEAKCLLTERIDSVMESSDNPALLRLGATLAFLSAREDSEAERIIKEFPKSSNQYVEYLASIMRLHLAVLKSDEVSIQWLTKELLQYPEMSTKTDVALADLKKHDFKSIIELEIELCLMAA